MPAYTIALVMIVRNEAHCLPRCLHSITGLVDQIVVVDTGSTDATVALAKAAGAEVAHFTWVNDFAAARNAALAHSRCDWQLVLDADEVLSHDEPTLAALNALRHTPPDFVGRIAVHSAFQTAQGAQQSAPSWLSRVLPKGARFEGVVHEQVSGDWPRRDLAIQASHEGYLPEAMARKGERNRLLLETAIQQAPQDAYLHYQLGKDHEVHDRFQAAWPCYEQALAWLGPQAQRHPSWRHDLVLRSLFTLKTIGHLQDALELGLAEQGHWHDSADFHFVLGDVLLDLAVAHPEQAHEIVPMIDALWQRCLALGDTPHLEGAVQGRGTHLVQHNLALLAEVSAQLGLTPSSTP